jgi:predicted amidophosphoribosyltransferase
MQANSQFAQMFPYFSNKESDGVQSDLKTFKRRRHRQRRICANCEQILNSVTLKCPRCDRLTPTLVHLMVFASLGIMLVMGLLKSIDLL